MLFPERAQGSLDGICSAQVVEDLERDLNEIFFCSEIKVSDE